jgi:hypothetical protein
VPSSTYNCHASSGIAATSDGRGELGWWGITSSLHLRVTRMHCAVAVATALDLQINCNAAPPTAGQLVTSERGVCGGPLAFHYANLMSHTAFRQSLAGVSLLYQRCCLGSQLSANGKCQPPAVNELALQYLYPCGL